MAAPRSMTAYTLNALKGWPSMTALDYSAEFDATIAAASKDVVPGSVVSLNSSGKYVLGVGNSNVMPMFVFNGSYDPDVVNPAGDPATDKGVWVAINPTGQALALVATGAYELVSTAYTGSSFPPNTPLTAATGTGSTAGLLAAGTINTNMIVGLVSRGLVDNGYGTTGLAFWPCPIFVQ